MPRTYDMHTEKFGIAQEQLTNELKAQLGDLITGISTDGETGLTVHFAMQPRPAEVAAMKAIVDAHTPQETP